MKCKVLMLSVLVFSSLFAQAQKEYDGNDLLEKCNAAIRFLDEPSKGAQDLIPATYCVGYISGVKDMSRMWQMSDETRSIRATSAQACIPGEVSNGQAIRVVVKFLYAHPERLHEPEMFLALAAFANAWPCKK